METSRPEVTLLVNGKSITFLCDTGACRTTCRETIPGGRKSADVVIVRAANGETKAVPTSDPLWIRDPKGETCQLSILLMPECPVNLLGRDAMLKLGLALVPTRTGFKVKRKTDVERRDCFVMQGSGAPIYYYTLDIPNKPPSNIGTALLLKGQEMITREGDAMNPEELHVTMWFKTTPDPDKDYEKELERRTPTKITINYMYSDESQCVAAGVILEPDIKEMHKMRKVPHISLYKSKDVGWQELGEMVQRGERATDWTATSVNTWVSLSTGLTRTSLFWVVRAQAGTHIHCDDT